MKAISVSVLIALSWFAAVSGQDVEVQIATEEPPHYVGVGAIVQLTVTGLEADPEPECEVQSKAPEIRVRLSTISPQIVQQMFRSGNRVRRVQQVTYKIQFRVTASKPGEFDIGPFLISQNGTQKRVDAIKMSFQEVPETEDMQIKLIVPSTTIYPDQRVPVQIEWWFAGETENVNSLNIDSPLFDEFQFAPDPPASRSDSRMPIQTSQGTLALSAEVRQETDKGKRFTVVSAQRMLIPDRAGTFEIAPITATIEVVTQWQRRRSAFEGFGFGGSLFDEALGGRRPAKVELFRAQGEPLVLKVKPFPIDDRPDSFSGAVGKGFSLDVAADRTVVRVGDPIRLTMNLRGDGNIEGASSPSLSADGGLDPEKFRLPEGDLAGVFDQGKKQFVVSVRVLDESINEIPGIAYSWFDTEKEAYETTRSKPIALRMMPAQVVGADSVVTNQPTMKPNGNDQGRSDDQTETLTTKAARPFSLSGADLAIETDAGKLLVGSTSLLAGNTVQITGYALGSLCLLIALIDRRRRQVDPAQRKAAATLHAQRNRVTAAGKLPAKEGATEIANALQAVAAEFPHADRSTLQTLMSECESIAYKPSGDDQNRVDQDLIDRALAAIVELNTQSESA